MRKLTVVLCALLAVMMMVPAFAAPSISDLSANVLNATAENIPEGMWIEVVPAETAPYELKAVADVVEKANAGEIATVQEAADALADYQTGDIDLSGYDFVTKFADLVLTDGSTVAFDANGSEVSATVEMAIDALKGVNDAADYAILLINTKTGELHNVSIDKCEDGVVTATFPCLGAFSVIQK